ncbi:hypothetical protein CIK76_03150 [Glutamicibacter sp. BW80]|uniref:hypothetical protein n=1 Tax=Glutamicibacter sp. BW80 TaxID=2024404 RepID=UPI000BB72507|nr:hypothetical protein [Glutamicibacter sp. BW80]PCC30104.1 hypothetical protein CIK76_03150 [Glutamicibacter sp. BW80]
MERGTKRVIGNVSVGGALIAIFGLLAVSHLDPGFLNNDPELTAKANAGTPIVQGPVVPKPLPTELATTDQELRSAKSMAVAAGRPEAAWDKNCVGWEFSQADANQSPWAKQAMNTWLESHGASCPDAITWPNYFVQNFSADEIGELTVVLENVAKTEKLAENSAYQGLEMHAREIGDRLAGELPDLREVTIKIESSSRQATVAID